MTVALVFGSHGFLGRRVVAALRAAGLGVVESERPGVARDPAVRPLDLAAGDADSIAAFLVEVDPAAVVNCAGLTAGGSGALAEANVLAVARLLDGIERRGAMARGSAAGHARALRLVHLGSAAEYGRVPAGVPVTETAATNPVSAYAVTKLAATRLVSLARERGTADAVVLRIFNAVGPAMPEHTLPGAAVRRLAAAVADGRDTVEMGPLEAVRDFVDVRDIAAAVAAAITASEVPPVVNVGSGEAHTARELVVALAARLGYGGAIVESGTGSARSTDVPWQVADIALARARLGWTPRHDLAAIADLLAGDAQAAGQAEGAGRAEGAGGRSATGMTA